MWNLLGEEGLPGNGKADPASTALHLNADLKRVIFR
ncbi:hypothetical protein ABIA45_007845 [Bradyrhizobium sp. USDA 336]